MDELAQRYKSDLVRKLAGDLGPKYAPGLAVIDNYRVSHPSQKQSMARVMEIYESIEARTTEGSGVIFYGTKGTGKDHLAAALLYRASGCHGIPARWVNGLDLFAASRDGMATERRESELIQEYTKPTILCISDPIPSRGDLSAWNVQLLYRILDKRYHAMRPTWATINAAKLEDIGPMISPPVWDRWQDNAELIPCFWPSNRKERRR